MMLSEEEAKTKWCPKVRVTAGTDGVGHAEWHTNRPSHAEVHEKNFDRCVGSACMAWRFSEPDTSEDFKFTPMWYPYEGDDRPYVEPENKGKYKPIVPVTWIGAPRVNEDVGRYSCGWLETERSQNKRRAEIIEQRKQNKPRKGYCGLAGPSS